jgi:hypothetical protein
MSITMGDAILYLKANPDALNQGLDKAGGQAKTWAGGLGKTLGNLLKVGFVAGAAGIAAGIGLMTKAVFEAADAGEQMAKFEATFGGASEGLIANLDEVAAATGRSRYELRSSAADFGAVTKALGFSEEGAADMSAAALQMAVDLGAFHNLPTEDVANRIQKALTGETESMKALGIVINQNRIKQELLNMGVTDNVNEVDEATKAQAIFNIIQGQTGDAVGIAAQEAGSFTGQMVGLKASFKDFMIEAGMKLLPLITPLVAKFGEFARDVLPIVVSWISDKLVPGIQAAGMFISGTLIPALQSFGDWIKSNKDTIVAGLTAFAIAIGVSLVPAFIAWAAGAAAAAASTLIAAAPIIALGAAIMALVLIVKNNWPKIQAGFEVLKTKVQPIMDGLKKAFEGVSAAVQKVVEWVKKFVDRIKNIKLPDWLVPGSPTPFELGLRGIGDALNKAVNPEIDKLSAKLQVGGFGASGGNNYDYSRTSNVPIEQMVINNGRDEQGIIQLLKNLSGA